MVDIHSHILPGVDDGAPTIEESKSMLRMAWETGTTDIVATPHANTQYLFDAELVKRLVVEVAAAALPAPLIHFGCDFHLQHDNIRDALAHPTRYTINNRQYLLVEFSNLIIFRNSGEILGELLRAGMVPIVTHPERNTLLQQRMHLIEDWVSQGCLLQVTAQSLTGGFGRRAQDFAMLLMSRNMAHFIASDAHDTRRRPPALNEAFAQVAARFGKDTASLLFVSNPKCVIEGRPIRAGEIRKAPRPRWFEFWKNG